MKNRKSFLYSSGILLIFLLEVSVPEAGRKVLERSAPDNEIPMYGDAAIDAEPEKSPPRIPLDENKEGIFKDTIQLAWKYFYHKDYKTSMKRFNQAWMIDPVSAEVYYGFGVLLSLDGKIDQAIPFYKKAIQLDSHHPMALANLGRSYFSKAYAIYMKKDSVHSNGEINTLLKSALELYEKAAQSATADSEIRLSTAKEDLSYIYYQWAIAFELNGQYAMAWEKIKLCRQNEGDHLIEPGFIQELSQLMPEPAS